MLSAKIPEHCYDINNFFLKIYSGGLGGEGAK